MGKNYKEQEAALEAEMKSKINSAGIINITLENLWRDSYSAIAEGNYTKWNRKLDAIWLILGGDVKEGDEEDKKFQELETKIYSYGSLGRRTIGFEKQSDQLGIIRSAQYLWLRKKALFLRRLQNSQGKGTAYASEDEDDI